MTGENGNSGSVSFWISRLKAGEDAAATELFDRYFASLHSVAKGKMLDANRVIDPEDVALSVFRTICRRAELGKLPSLENRGDLWALMLVITGRKAIDAIRWETRQKRGGDLGNGRRVSLTFDDLIGNQPAPEFIAMLNEQHERLFRSLADESLLRVAEARMQGYGIREIATQMGVAERTIYRKLDVIKSKWMEALD